MYQRCCVQRTAEVGLHGLSRWPPATPLLCCCWPLSGQNAATAFRSALPCLDVVDGLGIQLLLLLLHRGKVLRKRAVLAIVRGVVVLLLVQFFALVRWVGWI